MLYAKEPLKSNILALLSEMFFKMELEQRSDAVQDEGAFEQPSQRYMSQQQHQQQQQQQQQQHPQHLLEKRMKKPEFASLSVEADTAGLLVFVLFLKTANSQKFIPTL